MLGRELTTRPKIATIVKDQNQIVTCST